MVGFELSACAQTESGASRIAAHATVKSAFLRFAFTEFSFSITLGFALGSSFHFRRFSIQMKMGL
jgi:hypothetical protein